jgi:hypothetical protein
VLAPAALTRFATAARSDRWRKPLLLGLTILAVAGVIVTGTRLISWWGLGGWPPHDAASHWLAGSHLRQGAQVYGAWTGTHNYLMFLWAPPWVVIYAVVSLVPLDAYAAGLLVLNVLALRYLMGSWLATGLLGWHPVVFDNLAIGNIDLLTAAVILATVRGVPGSGAGAVMLSFAKFSPALALSRRTLRAAVIGGVVGLAITLPWLSLWPEWVLMVTALQDSSFVVVPILPRIPFVLLLIAIRRPWAQAAAAGLATPAFYFHSLVLLLPAARLLASGYPRGIRLTVAARGEGAR